MAPQALVTKKKAPAARGVGASSEENYHAATSRATRSRSAATTGASGARTGPPYSPTASMAAFTPPGPSFPDRKSTRLNSSHTVISYAVFCLKKKKKQKHYIINQQDNKERH